VNLLDNLNSLSSIVSLPAAVITVWAALRRPGAARTIVLSIALPIAIAAYTLDVGDRLGLIKLSETGDLIQSWGQRVNNFYMIVNSRRLWDYKDNFKMVLVLEIPYAHLDKMTDTSIEKSTTYTITGDVINVAASLPTPHHLRVIATQPNVKVGDEVRLMMDFNLVIIPNNILPEQITSLSDVGRLGGKIVATHGRDVGFIVTQAPG
jgi:hypothetical protein